MDWKTFYRDELACPEGEEFLDRCFDRLPEDDEALDEVIRTGGILSFPHTSLRSSGEPISRVVAALYRTGTKRVIALGVLHCGSLPSDYCDQYEEYQRLTEQPGNDDPRIAELFRTFRGAFPVPRPLQTVYGEVPVLEVTNAPPDLFQDRPDLIANEFSLDTFLAVLALYARARGLDTLPVLPLYIGLTRGPDGSFDTADALAAWLADAVTSKTAVVSTGDLVHYGHAYCGQREMVGLPEDLGSLTDYFRGQVEEALSLALRDQDYDEYHRIAATRLKADHRNVLPVLAQYLGSGASCELLSFSLSDYAPILGVAPPCVVASALAAYVPRVRSGPEEDYEFGAESYAPRD